MDIFNKKELQRLNNYLNQSIEQIAKLKDEAVSNKNIINDLNNNNLILAEKNKFLNNQNKQFEVEIDILKKR